MRDAGDAGEAIGVDILAPIHEKHSADAQLPPEFQHASGCFIDSGECLEGRFRDGMMTAPGVEGAQPALQTVNGRADHYLAPATPGAATVEPFFASDYFDRLYAYAVELIKRGKAYVCDLSPEDTEKYRGSPELPGRDSPFRQRSVEENLDLFARMQAGEFPDGARTLRSKIDMASPNMWLRDPLLYRIRHVAHHHAGDRWCIYPLYDYAHCLSDYLEGVTHSLCSLEFIPHRALYDWILGSLDLPRPLPHQHEFAKLLPTYTLLSKRNILRLVQEGIVGGWDDPRLPTIVGLRRRGVPAAALRRFAIETGITTYNGVTDIALVSFLLYLLLFDLADYALHRAQHHFDWWWQLHALHHSQQQMTMWSDNRNHLLDDLIRDTLFVGLALLVGVAPSQFVAIVAITQLVESLSHANVRLSFGRLGQRLLVGPQYHRLHHRIGIGHESAGVGTLGGHNFAVLFPLWDLLFGTARFDGRYEPTGIRDQLPEAGARDYGRGFWAQQGLGLARLLQHLPRPGAGRRVRA